MKCSLVLTAGVFYLFLLLILEVRCFLISDIRLQKIDKPRGGIVEVELQGTNGVWKQICAPPDVEESNLAEVICDHLGFDGISSMPVNPPEKATRDVRVLWLAMSCISGGLLEDCTTQLQMEKCEKLAYIECDSEPMSCTNRCGKSSNSEACGCDANCVPFGDCCHDFTEMCPQDLGLSTSIKRLNSIEKELYKMYEKCLPIYCEKNSSACTIQPTKYKMVAKCPLEWTNQKVIIGCETNVTFSNFLTIIPVHNEVGILFKNSYCALCHGTAVDAMLPWKLESDDSKRWVAPPRNIWGSQYKYCNKCLKLFKSCPPGTNRSIAEQCESYMKPETRSFGIVVKNKYCADCNNETTNCHIVNDVQAPVTFDVIFGIKSWSTLTSSCKGKSHLDVSGLFQNACPLLEELSRLERDDDLDTTDKNQEECVTEFMSRVFQEWEMFYQLNMTKHIDRNGYNIWEVILPNKLAVLYLENTVRNELVVPECRVVMSVLLPNNYHCNTVGRVDFEGQPFDNKIMEFDCDRDTCEVTTYYQNVCKNLTCRWEHEYLSPIDFRIEDFVAMEMTHVSTGAVLTGKDFTVTKDRQIHTCSEHLIGPWIRAAFFIQIICGPLSLICIILMIGMHVIFSKLRNIYGFCIVSLLSMIFMSMLLFMISTLSQMVGGLAQVVAALSHYAWLSAFAWMTVISFHVSHTFGSKFVANRMSRISNRKESLLYSLFGWGIPLPFFIIGMSLHVCDCTDFHYTTHWMSRGLPSLMLFAFPAGVMALTTTILFIFGIGKLLQRQATPHESESSRFSNMQNYIVALRLCFIVGIPWVLFIIYVANRNRFLLPILTLVNSLQGCFIFLSFVTTKRVRALIMDKLTEQHFTTTTYSKGKHTAHTEMGATESPPRSKRGKLSASSSPSGQ